MRPCLKIATMEIKALSSIHIIEFSFSVWFIYTYRVQLLQFLMKGEGTLAWKSRSVKMKSELKVQQSRPQGSPFRNPPPSR